MKQPKVKPYSDLKIEEQKVMWTYKAFNELFTHHNYVLITLFSIVLIKKDNVVKLLGQHFTFTLQIQT